MNDCYSAHMEVSGQLSAVDVHLAPRWDSVSLAISTWAVHSRLANLYVSALLLILLFLCLAYLCRDVGITDAQHRTHFFFFVGFWELNSTCGACMMDLLPGETSPKSM